MNLIFNIQLHLISKSKYALIFIALLLGTFASLEAQTLKFAFLTDLHVSPQSDNEEALHRIVDEINTKTFDVVIVTGDLSNTGSNEELLAVKKALDKLNKPLLIIPGNHETNWSESAGLLFNQLWGNDRFISHINGYMLIGFNTGPFMKMGDGHVKQEDIQWLQKSLKANNDEIVISFAHYPIADGLDNWTDVSQILNDNKCILSFCGHGHQLTLLNFNNLPGIMGRALKDKKGFGYNIVEIKGNEVIVTEQLLDDKNQPSIISLDLSSKEKFKELAISPKPDFSVNLNSKAEIDFEFHDTASIFSGPCLGDSLIIYGNSLGWIKAIRIKNKSVKWECQFKGAIYSTPVIASGKVVFGTADGYIKGLSLINGKEEWSVNVGSPVLAEAFTEKNFIYIGGGNKAFYKINATDGNVIWSYNEIAGPVQGKPALSGNNLVFGAWDTHLYCLDKETGNLNWKWSNGKKQQLLSPGNIVPAISGNKVFIVAPDRYFTAIDISNGKEIWRTNKHRVRESMGISPDGKNVYAKLMNDSIISVSTVLKDFKTNWAVDAGIGYDHNPCPVVSNKTIVVGATKNGLLVALDPKTRSIQWKYKIGNASINKLVLQKDGKLWLTTTEGKIITLSYKH